MPNESTCRKAKIQALMSLSDEVKFRRFGFRFWQAVKSLCLVSGRGSQLRVKWLTHKGYFFAGWKKKNFSEQVTWKKDRSERRSIAKTSPSSNLKLGAQQSNEEGVFVLCFDESFHQSCSLLSRSPAAGKRPVHCSAVRTDLCGRRRPLFPLLTWNIPPI